MTHPFQNSFKESRGEDLMWSFSHKLRDGPHPQKRSFVHRTGSEIRTRESQGSMLKVQEINTLPLMESSFCPPHSLTRFRASHWFEEHQGALYTAKRNHSNFPSCNRDHSDIQTRQLRSRIFREDDQQKRATIYCTKAATDCYGTRCTENIRQHQ